MRAPAVSGYRPSCCGVDPLPVLGAGPFELAACDDDQGGSTLTDGLSTFDLTDLNGAITLDDDSLSVFYFASLADQADGNPIADPTAYQTVVPGAQNLFVTVVTGFGCEAFATVTLRVLPNPTPATPTGLEVCDDGTDGEADFNLTDKDGEITDGEPGVSVVYYATEDDAVAGDTTVALTSPHTSASTTVYARVTRDVPPGELPCFTVVPLDLVVNPLPGDSGSPSDVIACPTNGDTQAGTILMDKDPEVLNGQDPSTFEVSYYASQGDADTMSAPIAKDSPFLFDTAGTDLYAGILNTLTGCYITNIEGEGGNDLVFNLVVKEGALAGDPGGPYVTCDNLGDSDGAALFTLMSDPDSPTELDAQADAFVSIILAGQDPVQFTLTYHESLGNAESGENPLPGTYQNITNPQVIFARVENGIDPDDEQPCFAIVPLTLQVEQLPVVLLEEEYRLCVGANGDPIEAEEGAQSPPVIDTGLDPGEFTFIWSLDGVVLPNEVGPSLTALNGGEYQVVITELATGCTSSVGTVVRVSSPPLVFDADVVSSAFAGAHAIVASASGEGTTYLFQLDDGPFQESGEFEGVQAGDHTVTIRDADGCGSVVIPLGVIDFPRFFTPNGDGFHETWNIIGIANGDPTAKIYIFDRNGKLLKQLSPSSPGWDGTFNGEQVPSSDYWFRVEFSEDGRGRDFTGHFTLKR